MSLSNPSSNVVNAIHQFPGRAAKGSTGDAAMRTLVEHQHAFPHVHNVLLGLLGLCATELQLRVSEALTEFEKQLIRLADKATMDQQNRCFDSARELRCSRADVVPRFLRNIEDSLARLGEPREDVARSPSTQVPTTKQYRLTITEDEQLDEAVVLSDIATRVEQRIREPLYALGQRLGELAGTPPFATEFMPLGPRAITEALRYGTTTVNLVLEHRLLLYRCFERVVMKEIGSLYNALNCYLVEKDVLPHLHVILTSSEPSDPRYASVHATNVRSSHPGAAHPIARGVSPFAVPQSLTADSHAKAGNARDDDHFAALQRLLRECRQAEAHTASGDDLQVVLATLQADRNATASVDGSHPARSGEAIKHAVLTALREHSEYGRMPCIAETDGDTIELVAMLFEFLSRRARPDGIAACVLANFQIPILRVALKDKRFFSDSVHPARQLLSDIVEASIRWVDELGSERDAMVVEKVRHIADRVAHDYQGNVLAFVEAQEELSRCLETMARRFEVVEQRLVDAARNRGRLERSKLLATAAIGERIAKRNPSEFLRTLLERGWVDALVVTLLRDGEGDSYKRRLEIVDQLIDSEVKRQDEAPAPLASNLHFEIENGLRQAGMHDEDIRSTIQKLFSNSDDENPISQTELAINLKRKTGLGEERIGLRGKPIATADKLDSSELVMQALGRVQTLPFGTWFEFSVNQRGDTIRRKLLWYSAHTGRCLLTDQRAVPAEIQTLQELACEIAGGRARLIDREEKPLIDQAWEGISEALANFSPRKESCRSDAGRFAPTGLVRDRRSITTRDEPPPRQEARTLLLVDDEENILRALTRALRGDGYRILTATSANRALEILGQQDIQVIISDQRMPEVSGAELLSKVKATYPNTIRIMLSGYSGAGTMTDAINRGVIYKFLTKPWDVDDIRLQVRDAFRAWEVR